MSFENSKQYKEALKAYKKEMFERKFKDIFNPTNVIVGKNDNYFNCVYLFYDQEKVFEIFEQIKQYYDDYANGNNDSSVHFGFEEPKIENFQFMGQNYEVIVLWYGYIEDLIPDEFIKKIVY